MGLFGKSRGRTFALTTIVALPLLLVAGCSSNDPAQPDNNAPVIASVTVTPPSVAPGGTATVQVTATDEDGDTLTYNYVPTGGSCPGTGPVVTWTASGMSGTYVVIVTVSDGNGGQAIGQGFLTVGTAATQVTGTVALPGGVPGNLANGVVSLYASYDDWNNYTPAMSATVVGTGTSVTYTIMYVPAGTWWIDYWLDNDFNTIWSTGDFVAWHGSGTWGAPTLTPFTITDGQSVPINMTAVLIP